MARKIFIGKYPLSGFEISLESVEPGKKFSETFWYGKAEKAHRKGQRERNLEQK